MTQDESFPRKHRLHKSGDFRRIFSRGKRIPSQNFVLYALPTNLPYSRLGIQVRSRIGNAVRRNYIKRIVREAFRRKKGDFTRSIDLIFIAEKGSAELKYAMLTQEFEQAVSRYLK